MNFRFGMVVGMKSAPELRALVLARAPDLPPPGPRWYRETWHALVLADEDNPKAYGWPPGEVVTVSPAASGVIVYDHIGSEEGA